MAQKITFTSVVLDSFSRKRDTGVAQFSASWNTEVAKALGWEEIPEFLSGASLDGDLAANALELVPKDKELKKHAVTLDVTRVTKFEAVRREIEGKRDKGHRTEIHFKVYFVAAGACQELERYMLTIGEGKGSLTVSYAKQEMLDGMAPTREQSEAVSEAQDAIFQ